MCAIANSIRTNCCRKLEIVFPSMSKEALEKIVTFLYSGKIICDKKSDASQTLSNLTKLLGYPDVMDFSQSIKDDEDLEYENVNFYRNSDNSKPEFHPLEIEIDHNTTHNIEQENQEPSKEKKSQNQIGKRIEKEVKQKVQSVVNEIKVCDVCGYSSPNQASIKKHIASVHVQKKQYTCNVCEKQFNDKNNLQKHNKVIHLGEKNFQCKVCHVSFKCSISLEHHKHKVHDRIIHKCDHCTKEFHHKFDLKYHNKKVHG